MPQGLIEYIKKGTLLYVKNNVTDLNLTMYYKK